LILRARTGYGLNCGAACGVNEAACVFAVMEQVQSSADVVINVASLVTTAGAATPAIKAAQAAGQSARRSLSSAARQALKKQAVDQIQNAMRWRRAHKAVERAGDFLDTTGSAEKLAEMLVTSYENGEFDFTVLIPSVADVEPTGMLALVNAFNKPICR
jgi:hypothetical protein